MLRLEELLSSTTGDEKKGTEALLLFYGAIPKNVEAAKDYLIWFYGRGKEIPKEQERGEGGYRPPVYSFTHDGPLIYAAFLAQYGIDLVDIDYLHWWKFAALFSGLGQEHLICEVMRCRGMELTGDITKEKRSYYEKMKRLHALPLPEGMEERLSSLEAALLGDGDVRGVLDGYEAEG